MAQIDFAIEAIAKIEQVPNRSFRGSLVFRAQFNIDDRMEATQNVCGAVEHIVLIAFCIDLQKVQAIKFGAEEVIQFTIRTILFSRVDSATAAVGRREACPEEGGQYNVMDCSSFPHPMLYGDTVDKLFAFITSVNFSNTTGDGSKLWT